MIAVIIVESAVLVVLCVLVAGLLHGYADVLRRLHRLDGGVRDDAAAGPTGTAGTASATGTAPPFRTAAGTVPAPVAVEGREEWQAGHDLSGVTLAGELATVRTVGVPHDTVIAFLSSGCTGCQGFWDELARPGGWSPTTGARLVVVTKDAEEESPGQLARLAPDGREVLMSSRAWDDFEVPGSPYVVVVDGRAGRIKGMGSGGSFSQISSLIDQAGGDSEAARPRVRKPAADVEREVDVDRMLHAAGIGPGHPSLYGGGSSGSSGSSTEDTR